MKCWVAPLLTVSPAHRLFMWLCEEQPLPLSAAHPHPSISHSARARLGGKSDLFCHGEFLGELVKASTVWAFISVERRRGRKERWRWRRLTEEGLDTASLVRQQPQRVIECGKERKQKSTLMMKQVERQKKVPPGLRHQCFSPPSTPPYPLPPSGSMLFRSITSFCPHPHPSSLDSHPLPLHYMHSIKRETRLREMSRVGTIIISALSFTSELHFTI